MRWALKVSAEKRNSRTGVGVTVRVQAPGGGAGQLDRSRRRDAGARLAIDDVLHLLDAPCRPARPDIRP